MNSLFLIAMSLFAITNISCGKKDKKNNNRWHAIEKIPREAATNAEIMLMDSFKCDYLLLEISNHMTQEECENVLASSDKRTGVAYFCSPTRAQNSQCTKL